MFCRCGQQVCVYLLQVRLWTLVVGHSLLFSSLFSRVWTVYRCCSPLTVSHPSPQSHVTYRLSCNNCVCAASMAGRWCAAQGSAAAGQRGADLLAGPRPPKVGGAAAGPSGRQLNTQTLDYLQYSCRQLWGLGQCNPPGGRHSNVSCVSGQRHRPGCDSVLAFRAVQQRKCGGVAHCHLRLQRPPAGQYILLNSTHA